MQRQDFYFELPEQLIARFPTDSRSASRLLHLPPRVEPVDHAFADLPKLLRANDLLVLNDSKVIPARVYGSKSTGGKIEVLLERVLCEQTALVKIKSSKSPRPGGMLALNKKNNESELVRVHSRRADMFVLQFESDPLSFFMDHGEVPLPPYLERSPEQVDDTRYQTIYAKDLGSVAAPTAGLHFDQETFQALEQRGVTWDFVTLHVGSGTYQPVRADNIEDHKMHAEHIEVSASLVEKIMHTKSIGGRVVAVGTTSLRCLESASLTGELRPFTGQTDIFIYPGYNFRCVDALLTNFHLPESTLLMLVSALAGRERTLAAYQHAVAESYRFFSYGDCILVEHD